MVPDSVFRVDSCPTLGADWAGSHSFCAGPPLPPVQPIDLVDDPLLWVSLSWRPLVYRQRRCHVDQSYTGI